MYNTVLSVAYLSEDKREIYANPKGSKLILLFFSPSVINVASRTTLYASSSSIILFIFHQ